MRHPRSSSAVWQAFRHAPGVGAALTGFAMQVAGAQALVLLLVWLAFTQGDLLLAGAVLAARSLPYVLAAATAGWLYDRVSVRRLVVLAAIAEAAAVLGVMAVREGATAPWLAVAVAVVLGAAGAVRETVAAAVAVDRARATNPTWGEAGAIGVGLAFDAGKLAAAGVLGLLLLAPAAGTVVAVAAVLAGGACLAWASAARPRETGAGPPAGHHVDAVGIDVRAWGLGLVLLVAYNMSAGQLMWLQGLLARAMLPAFVLIALLFAVGALAGNVSAARWGLRQRMLVAGLLASAAGVGLGYLAVGQAEHGGSPFAVWLAVGACAASWGWGAAVVVQVVRVIVVAGAPARFRGRASALFQVAGRTSLMLSGLLLGAGAAAVGAGWAVAGVCAATVALAAMPVGRRGGGTRQ